MEARTPQPEPGRLALGRQWSFFLQPASVSLIPPGNCHQELLQRPTATRGRGPWKAKSVSHTVHAALAPRCSVLRGAGSTLQQPSYHSVLDVFTFFLSNLSIIIIRSLIPLFLKLWPNPCKICHFLILHLVVLCMFTLLYDHHHCPPLERFQHLKLKLCPHSALTPHPPPSPLPLAPVQPGSAFCLQEPDCSGHTWNCVILSFSVWLVSLSIMLHASSVF